MSLSINTIKTATKHWTIDKSAIHGFGVFATKPFKPGEIIGQILERHQNNDKIIYKRTLLGKYVNHQEKDNAKFEKQGYNYYLIATEPILAGQEIVTNYNDYENLMDNEHIRTGIHVQVI